MYIKIAPKAIAVSTLANLGMSMFMKKTMVKMPAKAQSPYITR